jgi:hypothetical protein
MADLFEKRFAEGQDVASFLVGLALPLAVH